jgi:hypothetical protein
LLRQRSRFLQSRVRRVGGRMDDLITITIFQQCRTRRLCPNLAMSLSA